MRRPTELDVIRTELERLVDKRFTSGLTTAEQHLYLRFANREIELLDLVDSEVGSTRV